MGTAWHYTDGKCTGFTHTSLGSAPRRVWPSGWFAKVRCWLRGGPDEYVQEFSGLYPSSAEIERHFRTNEEETG